MLKVALSLLVVLNFLALEAGAQLPRPAVTILDTFDYPLLPSIGTQCSGINNAGDVVGFFYYYNLTFDFEREADGTFRQPITAPGRLNTIAKGINNSSDVCGWFNDTTGQHGFFFNGRHFHPYDFPGAVLTNVNGINDAGDFVGTYTVNGVVAGFASIGGERVLISVPSAIAVVPTGINNQGEIVGFFLTNREVGAFGFYRDPLGNVTFPISGPRSSFTLLSGINDQGDIAGQWEDKAIDYNCHGMILHLPHRIVTFDIPGSYSTAATGINNSGQICGYFLDSVGSGKHGFTAQMTEP